MLKRWITKWKAIWKIITHRAWFIAVCDRDNTYLLCDMNIGELADVNQHMNNKLGEEVELMNAVNDAVQLANGHAD